LVVLIALSAPTPTLVSEFEPTWQLQPIITCSHIVAGKLEGPI
jgi:hypothetical protein